MDLLFCDDHRFIGTAHMTNRRILLLDCLSLPQKIETNHLTTRREKYS
jgi:hypothetical protein